MNGGKNFSMGFTMFHCPICNTDDPKTTRLWDGKEYCQRCLQEYSMEFEDYARSHPELVSRLDNPGSLIDPKKSWKQCLPTSLLIASTFGFLSIFAFVDGSQNVVSFDLPVMLGCVVFIVLFLFSYAYMYILLRAIANNEKSPLSPSWGMKLTHPTVTIRDNEVFVSYYAGMYGRNHYVVPLKNVKLLIAPASRDPILERFGAVETDVLLLDFSGVDFKRCGIEKAWFDTSLNAWIRTPYLACCNDQWTQPIWEHFFEIIRGRAVLLPVEKI